MEPTLRAAWHSSRAALIRGLHGLFYTPRPEELRAYIRDKLGFPYIDIGGGWLIFDMPESDLGCHPSKTPSHSLSFYCDDFKKTVNELKSRGVESTSGISKQSWGYLTHFRMPGGLVVELYEPTYKKARTKVSRKVAISE